jgi:parallel beta-helix repeat protein
MMEGAMKKMLVVAAAGLFYAGALPGVTAELTAVSVDCDRGQRIANALLQGDFRKPLVVNIRGTCNGSVLIDRDNVTLRGAPTATINATNQNTDTVTVAAKGVSLEQLTLSGGNYGVRNNQVFGLTITDCVIQDTRSDGIRIFVGDTRLVRTTVQRAGANGVYITRGGSLGASNSQFLNNHDSGVYAYGNSTASVSTSTLSGNVTGVLLGTGSVGVFSGNTISWNTGIGLTVASSQANIGGDNTIVNNSQTGIWIYSGSMATIYGNTIEDNGWDGVAGDIGTTLVMNENQIRRNGWFGIVCRTGCTMELNSHTVQDNGAGGVFIERATKLTVIGTVNSTGNGWGLHCGDKESSVGGVELLEGTVSDTCTDYDH